MLSPFAFATATEILFGRGQMAGAAARVAAMGRVVLLVHGSTGARAEGLARALEQQGCSLIRLSVGREPDLPMIEDALPLARGAEVVLAMGGGAVIDAGKALAACLTMRRPLMDHLEVIGQGLPLDQAPLPFVAIPTTAGTGAEVTRNAVIGVPEARRKVSLRDARMLPRLAIVDPDLTDGCPRGVTLASGLDAITQVIEPYVSTRANAMTDALCRDAIPQGLAALMRLMESEDAEARDRMAWVSLCGGLALANAGLGVVHGLAGPLGGLTGAAHGAICGVLLPHGLRANRAAAGDPALAARLDQVAGWIGAAFGVSGANMDQAARLLADWSRNCGLPSLTALGIDADAQLRAAQTAASSSSMKANPAVLSPDALHALMRDAG
ncbi:iron-containing alcohol dehydrogenase [Paracoccus bogoriensis]|uniref:iron-containing alcohol dehydrogenase n=1 Tax=Paracoccus bogoriensis TaxID=242065 RepID=UPI001C67B7AC|nr:iron-containing alcohol dehydrogenase [Paracoccus bogoriensis]MBW7056995.1 iron-containing alcohol dehydrogenase [Paracoccus bogoriensis]